MSKLPVLKSHDIIAVLQKSGFVEHRKKGGHKIFKKGNQRVTVPIHTKDIKKGTIHSIITGWINDGRIYRTSKMNIFCLNYS